MTLALNSSGYCAIVPAAGIGKRMQAEVPKQYLKLGELTVLEHSLKKLCSCDYVEKIIVAIAPKDNYWQHLSLSKHPKVTTVLGGDERCHSVFNALQAIKSSGFEWILVHDAVRPCVTVADINKLVQQLQQHPVGGLLGVPVRDTLKQVDEKSNVVKTLERSQLWHALTPQLFRYKVLEQALNRCQQDNYLATDEAAAIEYLGLQPQMVQGSATNIKITLPEELDLAEWYLQTEALCV